jgi:hypothetical protein
MYLNKDLVMLVADKPSQFWCAILEQQMLLQQLNATIYGRCHLLGKKKAVGLLHTIQKEKGETFVSMLNEKLRSIPESELSDVKALIHLLSDIMHKPCNNDIVSLSENIEN